MASRGLGLHAKQQQKEPNGDGPLPVSAVVEEVARTVHWHLGRFAVTGEVSELKVWRNGTWYFSLKDSRNALPCVMRERFNKVVSADISDGVAVVAHGRIDFHKGQSRVQLIVDRMEPTGRGQFAEYLERQRKKLAAEGLFDADRKKPIPKMPRVIGVVTSPQGAALHDIRKVMRRRHSGVSLLLSPSRVQGDGASKDIAAALERLDRSGRCDVIIVGRGGGSLEDLMSFNMEVVVRAIAGCKTPIISSVGHEIDDTLADLAADLRAATPSHAAELAVPERDMSERHLAALLQRLKGHAARELTLAHRRLNSAHGRLGSPERQLRRQRHRLTSIDAELASRMRQQQRALRGHIDALSDRLEQNAPDRQMKTRRQELAAARLALSNLALESRVGRAAEHLQLAASRLVKAQEATHQDARTRLADAARALHQVSPLTVLDRGYALVTDDAGRLLPDGETLVSAGAAEIQLRDGVVPVQVTGGLRPRSKPDRTGDNSGGRDD